MSHYDKESYQSLLTSQKISHRPINSDDCSVFPHRRSLAGHDLSSSQQLEKSDEKRLTENYREKMRNYLQPGRNPGRQSNLLKKMAMRSSSDAINHPLKDVMPRDYHSVEKNKNCNTTTTMTEDLQIFIGSADGNVGQQQQRNFLNSSRVLDPKIVKQLMKSGRRKAEIRINKNHARFESTGKKLKAK